MVMWCMICLGGGDSKGGGCAPRKKVYKCALTCLTDEKSKGGAAVILFDRFISLRFILFCFSIHSFPISINGSNFVCHNHPCCAVINSCW